MVAIHLWTHDDEALHRGHGSLRVAGVDTRTRHTKEV